MKVLEVTESFGAGVYSFLVDLCNELSKDNDVTLVYSRRKETPVEFNKDFSTNVKFRELNMKLSSLIFSILKLKKIIIEERPDIIHFHSSKAGIVGRLAVKLACFKGSVYYNPHGPAFLRKDISKFYRIVIFLVEKFLAKLGGTIIAVSNSEKKVLEKVSKNTICISNGIDIEKFLAEINDLEEYIYNSSNITIGTVGRIEFQKNPFLFNNIAAKLPEVQFVWIGDGTLRNELKSDNIKVTGWKKRGEVVRELSQLDVYIQTSLWEGLPISVLEAMVMKKPVFVTNVVGNIDLVEEGKNGYIFKNEEDFVKKFNILVNDNKVINAGEQSYKIVKDKFDKINTIVMYKKVYQSAN